jgi:diadenosine tetraphosphate (Ap4A) HIT family hydrolase
MLEFTLHPRLEADSHFVRDLPLSQLRLNNQQQAPWLLLVPRRAEIMEIYDLVVAERAQLIEEIALTSRVLKKMYAADKINIATIGNKVPQLHIHIVARFKDDIAWPNPVWGYLPSEPYAVHAIANIKSKLNDGELWR